MHHHLLLFSGAGNRSGVGEEEQSEDLGEGERVWLTGQGTVQGGRQEQRSLEYSRPGPLGSLAPACLCSHLTSALMISHDMPNFSVTLLSEE